MRLVEVVACSDFGEGRWLALVLTSAIAKLSDWAFAPGDDLLYGYFTLSKTSFLLLVHGHASFPGVYRTKHRDSLQRGPPCCLLYRFDDPVTRHLQGSRY